MNYQDLKQKLSAAGGKVVISQSTLTSGVSDFLAAFYNGQPIEISEASTETEDTAGGTVHITGRASFLGVADLPVSARFSVDAQGEVHASLRYRLRDTAPGPDAWTFSRSFPKLPTVVDYATELSPFFREARYDPFANQRSFLDALDLFDTFFVVSTHAGLDLESDLPLGVGINFVSRMRPQGLMGVLEHGLGDSPTVPLYGVIRIPKPTERTLALTPMQRAWDRPEAPGIHLQSPLSVNFKLGALSFQRAMFQVYSPHSTDWMAQNPSFKPVHGYSGTLSIPSAELQIKLGADLKWNLPQALLSGQCEGISLGKLTQLVDLTGTDGLSSYLPQELQKAVDALDKLELMYVAVDVGVAGVTPTMESAWFTVGLPNLKWKVWGDHLEVKDIACRFNIRPAAQKTSVSVTLYGTLEVEGVPLSIYASSDDSFTVRATTKEKISLPLDKLMKTYAPGVPPPSALAVDSLGVTVAPGRSYEMMALLAGAPDPWVIPIGPKKLTVSDVVLALRCSSGAPLSGSFAGKMAFGDDIQLDIAYDLPGDVVIRSTFERVNLTKLIDQLCDVKVPMPDGFDLVLDNASVLIQKRGNDGTFQVGASVKDVGLFAFEVSKVPGKGWGFAAGLSLGNGRISQLPGLSALRELENTFKLEKLMVVISSLENAGFTFPDMAQFNRPELGAKLALPAQATGVVPGLMAFAEWKLDSNSREQKLLMSLLGLGGTQSATVVLGANPLKDFRLYVRQQSKIQGNPFQSRFGVELNNGKPSFFLTGSLAVKIQGQPQNFDVTTAFLPGGALLSATVKGSTAINCGPFKLSNLALQVGVNWAGIPSLGVACTIDVKKFQSSLAVFFDSTDPSRSLVAGSISSLTLKDVTDSLLGVVGLKTPLDEVLETIAIKGTREFSLPGSLASELDGLAFDKVATAFAAAKVAIPSSSQQLTLVVNAKGSSWHLTDLSTMRHYELTKRGDSIQVQIAPQFYFAPQPTAIGTIKYPQGYYINAAISFAGFDAAATIEISQSKGFSVDAQMDKIVLVDEQLFALTAAQGGGGPRISISTFNQPANPVQEFRPPHFYINGSLTMLGLKRSIYASVTTKGIEFELQGKLLPGVDFDVEARFGKSGLEAGGKVKVGVGTIDLGPLGKAKINTDLEAELELELGKEVELMLDSSFDFAGQHFKIAKFKVDAKADALAKLPEQMAKKVEAALRDVFKDVNQWANAVGKGFMDGVDDTEKVFRDVYGKSAQEAKALANSIGRGVNQAGKAIEGAAKDTGKAVEGAAKDTGKAVESAAKSAGKELNKTANKAKKAFKKIF
ncbi:hypothetical protein ATI61_11732 [Archangium gephyra]|uniref:Surface exclusion protein Sea1 n=1 Tax=Archangium gephyra TaxID=48 RepID=A0AAC8Q7U6_9BACT|nr:hypothetical protein [Archangium gephyra]AKJ02643.1 Surface exclusion protein Sea1 [Archangium gephyra]REG23189.1 hypothetical protein ATI61_11732 [Archangium gephyra]